MATYTEFYCQSGGSNLNAGSTNNNTPVYSSIHGNWTQATGVFTPTDGSTPASTVSTGMWASVYIDGASVGVYIGRISNVVAGVNGAITANTTGVGAKPANQTGTATIVVGGAWLGPNAASGFPFTLSGYGNNINASSNTNRTNLKNDQTYSMTAAFTPNNTGNRYIVQGYTGSVGDGGKATFDGGTSTGAILSATGPLGNRWEDLIFTTSITTGTSDLVSEGTQQGMWIRCVFSGARGSGFNGGSSGTLGGGVIECEAYNNNRSNTASKAGFQTNGTHFFVRCVSHDNTGSNTAGFLITGGDVFLQNCISDTNGGNGVSVTSTSPGLQTVANCDIYNNGGDGINCSSASAGTFWIENTNFIKNTGAGINNASTSNDLLGYIYNGGYGAGTQANGSSDTVGQLVKTGTVTYASNVTPWVDPANGDFRINLAAANFAGRQAFQQTQGYSSPNTVGYPDIGAAQSLTGGGGTFSKQKSYGYA